MKTSIKFKGSKWLPAVMAAAVLTTAGCTKNFEELNTNPAGITDEQGNADYALIASFLSQAQRNIIPEATGTYQLANNLASDAYAGYLGIPTAFESNSNNLTYRLVPGWYLAVWNDRYIQAMNPIHRVLEFTQGNELLADVYAFAKLLKVAAMHRTADKVGPIIYTKYNQPDANGSIEFDAQPDVYRNFFLDLDTAMTTFKGLQGQPTSSALSLSDLGYSSDNYTHLLKLANSLRLRLAMRVSMVDPELARTEGEKALDPANGGLIEENADNWMVRLTAQHPLNEITSSWSDTRMAAGIESYLKGYNDPRLPKMFEKATDPAVEGEYKGIRVGILIDAKSRYENYSKLVPQEPLMQLFTAAETWFLKAEAGLRGWSNAGDVKTNYETGVRRSFQKYDLSGVEDYLADDTSTPAPYVDPKSQTPGAHDIPADSPYLSDITIKWDDAASNDEKLERIITQKWLAIFPDGDEAWAEYRRTGYPIQFPVVVNYSNGAIPTVPGIRRLPYAQREYDSNSAGVARAVELLGGPDNGGTRLWWDVEDKSF